MPRGTRDGEGRKERTPMGVRRLRLALPKRMGFHRHWFKDWVGRHQQALDGDYTPILDEKVLDEEGRGTAVTATTGVNPDGTPEISHAMEIPLEYYEADQREKQKPLDEFDAELRRGTVDPERGNAAVTSEDRGKIYGKTSSIKGG